MYKKASDLQSYQQRVASHATKPSPTGRIDDLPPWAREPEEYYRSLRDQLTALLAQLRPLEEECAKIAAMLRLTLPRPEYERIRIKKDALGQKKSALERALHDLRPLTRSAAMNSFGTTHYLVCERLLDKETRIKIENEVRQLLGRPIQEFKMGDGERPDEARRHSNRKTQVQRKIKKLERTTRTYDNHVVRWEPDAEGIYRKVIVKDGKRFVAGTTIEGGK